MVASLLSGRHRATTHDAVESIICNSCQVDVFQSKCRRPAVSSKAHSICSIMFTFASWISAAVGDTQPSQATLHVPESKAQGKQKCNHQGSKRL